MTIADVSNLSTLAKSTIYSFCRSRDLKFFKIGSRIVFDEKDIKKWLQKHQVKQIKRK